VSNTDEEIGKRLARVYRYLRDLARQADQADNKDPEHDEKRFVEYRLERREQAFAA